MEPISNPGEQLYGYVEDLLRSHLAGNKYLDNVDSLFYADGDLVEATHSSLCYYVARRLITFAVYKERQLRASGLIDTSTLRTELRSHLKFKTRFPDKDHEKLIELMIRCVSARRNGPSTEKKKRLLVNARANNVNCYLCGGELEFGNTTGDKRPIIEHIWPQSLGGSSQDCNLKVSCAKCSELKGNILGLHDSHFEEMSLITSETDSSFLAEYTLCYRLAFRAKDDFKCSVCGKPAEDAGELYSSRIDEEDSFHFFNVTHACVNHKVTKGS